MAGEANAFVLLIVAWIFPPAAVAFVSGCSADLCLNILLTLLGYLPGCIHAFWLVLRRAEADEKYGRGNWTYIGMGEYFPGDQRRSGAQTQSQAPPPPPPGLYPAAPFSSQAPVNQKQDEYVPPPAPAEQRYGGGYQAPSRVPAEQRAVEVAPRAPADEKSAESTAPPTGT